jgi:GNAT superfamily N-acetyltransferase
MHEPQIEGGTIRKLWIGETDQYRDHLLRLDPASRRNRFSGTVSDAFIRSYVGIANGLDAVIHAFFVAGLLRGAAELRPLGATLPQEAELAFSIETPWQSHGVGTALLDRTLLAARNRGFKLLHMACLADNRRMQQLASKFEAELSFDFGSVIGELEATHATPMSVMREIVADGHGFATAVLDVQSRLLRRPDQESEISSQ